MKTQIYFKFYLNKKKIQCIILAERIGNVLNGSSNGKT